MDELRRKLRVANRERGRVSLTLHMTRLQLSKARDEARRYQTDAETEGQHGRQLYYQMRELMEVARPGMTHGNFDDDYKSLVAELRRLRSLDIVAQLDAENATVTAELMPMAKDD